MTRLIKQINFPSDLRKFKKDQLKQIETAIAKKKKEKGWKFQPDLKF